MRSRLNVPIQAKPQKHKGERKRKKKKPIIDVFMEGKLILEKL